MSESVRMIGDPARPVRLVENPDSVTEPVLAFFLDYWRTARGAAALPVRDSFVPKDVGGKLAWVVVLDALPECTDFRYRVVGARVCDYYGTNATGKTVRKAFEDIDPAIGKTVVWIMRKACSNCCPIQLAGPAIVISEAFCPAYDSLYMPYSSDGAIADRIVSAFVFNPVMLVGSRDPKRMIEAG
jgi:hypothetical protein